MAEENPLEGRQCYFRGMLPVNVFASGQRTETNLNAIDFGGTNIQCSTYSIQITASTNLILDLLKTNARNKHNIYKIYIYISSMDSPNGER